MAYHVHDGLYIDYMQCCDGGLYIDYMHCSGWWAIYRLYAMFMMVGYIYRLYAMFMMVGYI